MKQNEIEYLDKLFASSSDVTDEVEVECPLVDVPEGLSERLYSLAEETPNSVRPVIKQVARVSNVFTWPKAASIAASLFVAVLGVQFYQQQQTLQQLERAQADLATALHYLGEANRIARAQVIDSLNDNIKRAGVEPAVEIGKGSVLPNLKKLETETQSPTRSL